MLCINQYLEEEKKKKKKLFSCILTKKLVYKLNNLKIELFVHACYH
jgi:hypothetical protein